MLFPLTDEKGDDFDPNWAVFEEDDDVVDNYSTAPVGGVSPHAIYFNHSLPSFPLACSAEGLFGCAGASDTARAPAGDYYANERCYVENDVLKACAFMEERWRVPIPNYFSSQSACSNSYLLEANFHRNYRAASSHYDGDKDIMFDSLHEQAAVFEAEQMALLRLSMSSAAPDPYQAAYQTLATQLTHCHRALAQDAYNSFYCGDENGERGTSFVRISAHSYLHPPSQSLVHHWVNRQQARQYLTLWARVKAALFEYNINHALNAGGCVAVPVTSAVHVAGALLTVTCLPPLCPRQRAPILFPMRAQAPGGYRPILSATGTGPHSLLSHAVEQLLYGLSISHSDRNSRLVAPSPETDQGYSHITQRLIDIFSDDANKLPLCQGLDGRFYFLTLSYYYPALLHAMPERAVGTPVADADTNGPSEIMLAEELVRRVEADTRISVIDTPTDDEAGATNGPGVRGSTGSIAPKDSGMTLMGLFMPTLPPPFDSVIIRTEALEEHARLRLLANAASSASGPGPDAESRVSIGRVSTGVFVIELLLPVALEKLFYAVKQYYYPMESGAPRKARKEGGSALFYEKSIYASHHNRKVISDIINDAIIPRLLHRMGVNLSLLCLLALLAKARHTELSSYCFNNAEAPGGSSKPASGAGDDELLSVTMYKIIEHACYNEVVGRTLKHIVRCDIQRLQASRRHYRGLGAEAAALAACNRIAKLLLQQHAAFWGNYVLPALRAKYHLVDSADVTGIFNLTQRATHTVVVLRVLARGLRLRFCRHRRCFTDMADGPALLVLTPRPSYLASLDSPSLVERSGSIVAASDTDIAFHCSCTGADRVKHIIRDCLGNFPSARGDGGPSVFAFNNDIFRYTAESDPISQLWQPFIPNINDLNLHDIDPNSVRSYFDDAILEALQARAIVATILTIHSQRNANRDKFIYCLKHIIMSRRTAARGDTASINDRGDGGVGMAPPHSLAFVRYVRFFTFLLQMPVVVLQGALLQRQSALARANSTNSRYNISRVGVEGGPGGPAGREDELPDETKYRYFLFSQDGETEERRMIAEEYVLALNTLYSGSSHQSSYSYYDAPLISSSLLGAAHYRAFGPVPFFLLGGSSQSSYAQHNCAYYYGARRSSFGAPSGRADGAFIEGSTLNAAAADGWIHYRLDWILRAFEQLGKDCYIDYNHCFIYTNALHNSHWCLGMIEHMKTSPSLAQNRPSSAPSLNHIANHDLSDYGYENDISLDNNVLSRDQQRLLVLYLNIIRSTGCWLRAQHGPVVEAKHYLYSVLAFLRLDDPSARLGTCQQYNHIPRLQSFISLSNWALGVSVLFKKLYGDNRQNIFVLFCIFASALFALAWLRFYSYYCSLNAIAQSSFREQITVTNNSTLDAERLYLHSQLHAVLARLQTTIIGDAKHGWDLERLCMLSLSTKNHRYNDCTNNLRDNSLVGNIDQGCPQQTEGDEELDLPAYRGGQEDSVTVRSIHDINLLLGLEGHRHALFLGYRCGWTQTIIYFIWKQLDTYVSAHFHHFSNIRAALHSYLDHYCKRLFMAFLLQRVGRGWMERDYMGWRFRRRQVLIIQRLGRGFLARQYSLYKQLFLLKRTRQCRALIGLVQPLGRGYIARGRVYRLNPFHAVFDHDQRMRVPYCVMLLSLLLLQRAGRGMIDRETCYWKHYHNNYMKRAASQENDDKALTVQQEIALLAAKEKCQQTMAAIERGIEAAAELKLTQAVGEEGEQRLRLQTEEAECRRALRGHARQESKWVQELAIYHRNKRKAMAEERKHEEAELALWHSRPLDLFAARQRYAPASIANGAPAERAPPLPSLRQLLRDKPRGRLAFQTVPGGRGGAQGHYVDCSCDNSVFPGHENARYWRGHPDIYNRGEQNRAALQCLIEEERWQRALLRQQCAESTKELALWMAYCHQSYANALDERQQLLADKTLAGRRDANGAKPPGDEADQDDDGSAAMAAMKRSYAALTIQCAWRSNRARFMLRWLSLHKSVFESLFFSRYNHIEGGHDKTAGSAKEESPMAASIPYPRSILEKARDRKFKEELMKHLNGN